ncbi:LPS assembly protein LptD [Geobacter pelophilus]|uniref:LPS assembly protein LptD n=1 Tax=Geoanaerobacter pelophilus TaxID=60036 RepID=A0AAW4L4M0_9BACT|nr:LPS assembly protein LptD [Geoanaerobacter pelophilus]MBT0663186.1 LPS assembly protein LptD [Geoanaerobacter pelophilus]
MRDVVRVVPSIIGALVIAVLTGTASAESNGLVKITADSIVQERSGETLNASGDVTVKWQDYTLFADRVEYVDQGKAATASGKVKLLRNDDTLTADSLKIGLDSRRGVATNSTLRTTEGNLRVKGALIEKVGDDQYRMEKGSFTTCDADPPSWKFSADDLDLTMEGVATGSNVVFSVADIPVFYTPYVLFPVKRERQTGFLFPRLGSSTKKGFFADIPFYWVLSTSAEVLFDLDIQLKRGVGTGVQGAWLGKNDSHGDINAYTIYDTTLSRERANVGAGIKEVITTDSDFNVDLNLATDRSFFRDFSEASGDYNRQALDSSISLTKRWHNWYLAGETRIVNDLDSTENQRTLQRLPELTLAGIGQRLGTLPLYAGIDSRFTNFYRREGVTGQRFTVQPLVSYYADLSEGLSLSGWGGYQQRLYQATGGQGEGARETGLAVAGARGSASFSGLFDVPGTNLKRIRHTITPALDYSFIQEKGQGDLPFFDYDDRVVGQNLVSWSLSNSVTGRFETLAGAEYSELFNFRLSQGYQLSGGRRDLLDPADEQRRFTDIRLEAVARPLKMLAIETDSRFSTYHAEVTGSAISAALNDGKGNEAGIGYRRIAGALDYLEGKLSVNLFTPFVFQYTGRYSFDRRDFLEKFFALEYRHQCWSITASYRDRPDNREFLVNFSLAGIGGLGKVKVF